MKVSVLEFDKPTVNGRVYSADEVTLQEEGLIYLGSEFHYNLENCIGKYTNCKIENNHIICDVDLINIPSVEVFKFNFTTYGLGIVEANVVTEFRLIHLNANLKDVK